MKDKHLSIDLYEQLIAPEERVVFWPTSPIPAITLSPTQGVFMAMHGVSPNFGVSSICGTAYCWRLDWKDSKPLNCDAYSIWVGNSSEQLQLKPVSVDFHHAITLPAFIENDAPDAIKDEIDRLMNSRLT